MSYQLFLLINSLTFLISGDVQAEIVPRIYKGNKTDVIENSFLAQIYKRNPEGRETFCSGALVAREWVVTAGHCLLGSPITEVWTEASDIDESFETHLHPKYQYMSGDIVVARADIGLIKIKPLKLEHEFAISLPLPHEDREFIDNPDRKQQMTLIGKGATNLVNSTRQHQFRVRIASLSIGFSRCYKEDRFYLSQGEVCSYSFPEHRFLSCKGDPGGPIFTISPSSNKKMIVAIFSSGLHRCEQRENALKKKTLEMYVRITAHMPWILHKIDALSPSHVLQATMDWWMVNPFWPNLP